MGEIFEHRGGADATRGAEAPRIATDLLVIAHWLAGSTPKRTQTQSPIGIVASLSPFDSLDIGAKHCIDARLVALPRMLEEVHQVGIQT